MQPEERAVGEHLLDEALVLGVGAVAPDDAIRAVPSSRPVRPNVSAGVIERPRPHRGCVQRLGKNDSRSRFDEVSNMPSDRSVGPCVRAAAPLSFRLSTLESRIHWVSAGCVLALLLLVMAPATRAADLRAAAAVRATSETEARAWGDHIEALLARGDLALARDQDDPDFPARHHLRYEQRVGGHRVFGAEVVRQIDALGRTLTRVRPAARGARARRRRDGVHHGRAGGAHGRDRDGETRPRGGRARAGRAAPRGTDRPRLDALGPSRPSSRAVSSSTPGPARSSSATTTCTPRPRWASAPVCGATARRSRPTRWAAPSGPTTSCARPPSRRTTSCTTAAWAATPSATGLIDPVLDRPQRRQHLDGRRGGGRPRLRRLHLRLLLQAPRPPRPRRARPADAQHRPFPSARERLRERLLGHVSRERVLRRRQRRAVGILERSRRGGPRADPRRHPVHLERHLLRRVGGPQRGLLRHHGHRGRVLSPAAGERATRGRLLPRRGPGARLQPPGYGDALDGEPVAFLLLGHDRLRRRPPGADCTAARTTTAASTTTTVS